MCEFDWSLIVTLIIGMLAAWVALVNVRNNIRMSATMKWIDDMRNLTSDYIDAAYTTSVDIYDLRLFAEKTKDFTNDDEYNNYHVPKVKEGLFKFDYLGNKLKMFLDPKDIEQNKVIDIMNTIGTKIGNLKEFKNIEDVNTNKKLLWSTISKLMGQLNLVFNNEKEKANRIKIFKY